MCGIIGAWGEVTEHSIRVANRMQAHRGPDDQGYYFDQEHSLRLAHVRLSIVDLSPLGHQPMCSDDGSVVLTFNGEIYNFRELRQELERQGVCFRSHSDTEVLLQLYLRDGMQLLPQLNGIFAFAIWDRRSKELFLARDALGVKPLYFHSGRSRFAFASEIKALQPLVEDDGGIDAVALHRYLSFLWCPGDGTPFKAIRKLGPGEAVVVRNGQVADVWQWYRLPAFRGANREPVLPSDIVAGTAESLRVAVHRQLIADVPVGAFLSGGLDSSAVVAMARERTPDIRCFTIAVHGMEDEGMADDLPYARKVAQHLGVPIEVVEVDSARMSGDLEQMVYQLDEPLADPAPLNVLYISRLARNNGIKVLLSGAGGDDLFTGYRRHLALNTERYWAWLPENGRNALEKMTAHLDQRRPLFRRAAKLFSGAGLEGNARLANYFVWKREAELRSLYTPEFRQAVGDALAVQPMLDFLSGMPESTTRMERLLALEQRYFLTEHNLVYTDKMSMAAGVEVRVPFLDIELVDFAARIPARFKQRGREGKWILKKAMEPYLPRDVIYRPKSGFGAPLRRWMRHELRPLLGDLLSEASVRRRGFFDADAIQRLIADNDSGRTDASYTLLSLLCIEIWCRRFVDGRCD